MKQICIFYRETIKIMFEWAAVYIILWTSDVAY